MLTLASRARAAWQTGLLGTLTGPRFSGAALDYWLYALCRQRYATFLAQWSNAPVVMAKARSGGFAYFLEAGETAHSICLEWVAQAYGELCLDSYSPLLGFASVLQAASRPPLPNFRTVFGAAGGL